MTGTAMTEAHEFHAIYKLEPVAVPTNKPIIRRDLADLIYGNTDDKFNAIAEEVAEMNAVGQPILVGTASVKVSEQLSELFTRKGIKHSVLNARQHDKEAEVVARAGHLGSVTVSTNMAGRGTDIKLGQCSLKVLLKHWKLHGLAPKKIEASDSQLDDALIDMWSKRWLDEATAEKARSQPVNERLDLINKARAMRGWAELPLPSSLRDGCDMRQLGGLRIVGTERHDSRRIDNQLRGRSGRQGDPGSSRFYLSLDDDLMKRFAGPAMANAMRSMGLKDGEALESKMVSRAVEKAQKRVEEFNFGIRKNLLEYDEVMNLQRMKIYEQRQAILEGDADYLQKSVREFLEQACDDMIQSAAEDGTRGETLNTQIKEAYTEACGLPAGGDLPVNEGGDACLKTMMSWQDTALKARREEFGEDIFKQITNLVLLQTMDRRWKDHIDYMDQLRRGIGLESYGQKDPKMRFKQEGFRSFGAMMELIRTDIQQIFFRLQVAPANQQMPGDSFQAGGFAPKTSQASQAAQSRKHSIAAARLQQLR